MWKEPVKISGAESEKMSVKVSKLETAKMHIHQFSWKGISAYICINIPLITVFYETKWRHLEICADILALLRFPFKPVLWHFISSNMDWTSSFLLVFAWSATERALDQYMGQEMGCIPSSTLLWAWSSLFKHHHQHFPW